MLLLPSGSRLNDNSTPPNATIQIARPSFYRPYCVFRALHGASALQRRGFLNLGAVLANSLPGQPPLYPQASGRFPIFRSTRTMRIFIGEVYVLHWLCNTVITSTDISFIQTAVKYRAVESSFEVVGPSGRAF